MNRTILKPIFGGVLLGTALFFTGPLIPIVLLLKFIFTPFGMGRMMMHQRFANNRGGFGPGLRLAMADSIRNMSPDEYNSFKEKMNRRGHHGCGRFENPQKENNHEA